MRVTIDAVCFDQNSSAAKLVTSRAQEGTFCVCWTHTVGGQQQWSILNFILDLKFEPFLGLWSRTMSGFPKIWHLKLDRECTILGAS